MTAADISPSAAPARRIYVASSWRNTFQPVVIQLLRAVPTFQVYDFRNPSADQHGFAWSEIDPKWASWIPDDYLRNIDDPIAVRGFDADMAAMEWANTFVLVLPCGRSAHLELGWAVGRLKETVILLDDVGFEPELMYRMVDHMVTTPMRLLSVLGVED